jgi:hypothetical protein
MTIFEGRVFNGTRPIRDDAIDEQLPAYSTISMRWSRIRRTQTWGALKASSIALLAISLLSVPASAVTVDASSHAIGTVGTTNLQFSHVLGSGSNRLVVCGVQIANPTTAVPEVTPSVTFGGYPMTAITESQAPTPAESNTSKIETEMFYLNDVALSTTSGPVMVNVTLDAPPTGGLAASCTSFLIWPRPGLK